MGVTLVIRGFGFEKMRTDIMTLRSIIDLCFTDDVEASHNNLV